MQICATRSLVYARPGLARRTLPKCSGSPNDRSLRSWSVIRRLVLLIPGQDLAVPRTLQLEMTDICSDCALIAFISATCRLNPLHQCSCGNSAGELSTSKRWLFGKTTYEEAPSAKKTHTSAICLGAWTLELVWWSMATRCVQWRIQIFSVSSRWSCSRAQTISRGSNPWVCTV